MYLKNGIIHTNANPFIYSLELSSVSYYICIIVARQ